jgi:carboxyl-terminal processing protease
MSKLFRFMLSARMAAFALVALMFIAGSCDDDDSPSSHTKVNNWILDNMEFWYFWNTQLPSSPDKNLAPDQFFESLLVTEDRFSWIQENYQELLNSLQGITKEAGFEFVLYLESQGSNNVIGQIVYVKPSSPAAAAGLKRGDIFSQINNQTLTVDNYSSILSQMGENYTMRYKPLDIQNETFGAEQSVSLQPVQYSENPNYLSKTFDIDGKKIGYYVYNFFSNGVDDGEEYADEMESIFANFKSQGVTDLIVDLRFNSGGAESAANNLSSYLGKGIDNTKTFSRKMYNADVEEAIINDPELGSEFLISKFGNKQSNVGNQLSNGRVYILTGSRTASASELVINALKPYMEVFLIGDVTVGKNVGSISLYEEDDPEITWGMQPIVVKIFNSLDQSDYGNGFTPNITDEDNSLTLYPLGDEREALLSHAIGHITGAGSTGRKRTGENVRTSIGHSLDVKRRTNQLVIDDKLREKIQIPF